MHWLRLFILLVWTLWLGDVRASDIRYVVAVVPQFSPLQIYQNWTPLLARIEQTTGYHFQLRVYDQIPRFETELMQGIPDFAFMNPYHQLLARQAQGYRPLVRDDATRLSGILVVRQDAPIRALADLNGKQVAFPSPNALGASLYMRALLAEKMHVAITPIYAGNHQNVYRQVLRGDVQAGGGVASTLAKEPPAVQSQLRILYTTPELAPHPLAAHPRVGDAVARKVTDALLALRNDPTGRALLAAVQMPQPVAANFDRDYAPLRQLKLDRYVESGGY